MSKAQFRRIVKGNWSDSDQQKREDSNESEQEQNSINSTEEDVATIKLEEKVMAIKKVIGISGFKYATKPKMGTSNVFNGLFLNAYGENKIAKASKKGQTKTKGKTKNGKSKKCPPLLYLTGWVPLVVVVVLRSPVALKYSLVT